MKTYMRIYYPGSFVSETTDREVKDRSIPERPERAYAIEFYDREEETLNGEVLVGKAKNFSKTYYWGEVYDLERLKREYGHERILISNIEGNGYKAAIKTVRGNWQTFGDNDEVINPTAPKRDDGRGDE